ncbi:MAG: glycerol-3-phosphate dehydrogenase/oxidase [Desulfobacteraceae bacterium]|nr:glycerol-3-phosphate dehydrogenase/oxidase [Desulfobacteraceae bacterium]
MSLTSLQQNWDLVVIGGGITGAGIFRETVGNNIRTLLVEQKDFAWGTSSRSSKMIHGGLRYLKQGKLSLTRQSVKARERMIKDAPGLVVPQEFLLPIFRNRPPGKRKMGIGLTLYDLFAHKRYHQFLDRGTLCTMEPLLAAHDLVGGFSFMDTSIDDAGLVLRLINESIDAGGEALNYTKAVRINRSADGQVSGVDLKDTETGEEITVNTNVVISATGAWSENLSRLPGDGLHLRPLRGSHIIFPFESIPITRPVSFFHPEDHRPLFVLPWQGSIMIGTTDLDDDQDLSMEPSISKAEVRYLITGIASIFPTLKIGSSDATSSFTGIRPILSRGRRSASKESREHMVQAEKGLVAITGGKLTLFRELALDALKSAGPYLRPVLKTDKRCGELPPVFESVSPQPVRESILPVSIQRRLTGRYGHRAKQLIEEARPEDLTLVPGTTTLWAELPHTAKNESVRHLPDLLLRRVRIGLLITEGGKAHLNRIQQLCQPVLPWDDHRWETEKKDYLNHCRRYYSLP